ncbi:MAG: O-antigen ligase family protein [Rudaea sp.]|uniref:O-antigen ligase family protein n=1 Tax=Rudaea sp. TaxID=2136325 RepID=UPI0039E43C9F
MVAPLPERRRIRAPLSARATVVVEQEPKPRHNWALYAFAFLLPLQNLQTGYMPNLGGGLNFLNIGFGLSLLGAMMCRGTISHWSPVHKWLLAYVVYAFISLFIGYSNVHSDTEQHFNVLKDAMLAVMLIFVAQMSVADLTTARRIILCTLLPMPYMLRVVWAQHSSVSSWHYSDNLRISGTFSLLGANEFSAFCVTMAVLLLALLLATRWTWRWRVLLIVGIVSMMLSVLWTYSRTAYVTIMLGSFAVILLWRGRWKMIVPLVLVALILPAVLPESVTERFQSTTIEEGKRDDSTEGRFEFWQIAWDNFLRHPLTGSGYHTFHHPEINPRGMDTHNFFMRELTEKGIIGSFITLGMLLSILRSCWRVMSESPQDDLAYALGLGMVAAWLALIVGNCWGDRFTYYPVIGYFWIYLGITLKLFQLSLDEKTLPVVDAKTAEKPAVPRHAQPRRPVHE